MNHTLNDSSTKRVGPLDVTLTKTGGYDVDYTPHK